MAKNFYPILCRVKAENQDIHEAVVEGVLDKYSKRMALDKQAVYMAYEYLMMAVNLWSQVNVKDECLTEYEDAKKCMESALDLLEIID